MIPDPTPVAVASPKGPRFVAIFDVNVTTESFALATTPGMSSCWTVVEPFVAWAAAFALGAELAADAGAAWGSASSAIARVEPDARTAARTAAPTIVPAAPARRGRRGVGGVGAVPDVTMRVGSGVAVASQPADDGDAAPTPRLRSGVGSQTGWAGWVGLTG